MKSFYLVFISLLSISLQAQTPYDALLFGQDLKSGSARFVSMGGSFGALGGNSSAATINAASIGIYRNGEFSMSGAYSSQGALSSHYNQETQTNQSRARLTSFNLNFNNEIEGGDWKHFNFMLAYNKRNNFDSQFSAKANNSENSKLDLYLNDILESGIFLEDIYAEFPFGAGLAWDAFLIDTIDGEYFHSMESYGHLQQLNEQSSGGVGDYFVGIGGNYDNKLYLGASLGITSINYELRSTYSETPFDDNDNNPLKHWEESSVLKVRGRGLFIRLGMIYWFQEKLRMGLAYNSGTNYNLTEEYKVSNVAVWKDGTQTNSESPDGYNKYGYKSPNTFTASIAWVDKYVGSINLDADLVTYGRLRFENSDGYPIDFTTVNEELEESTISSLNFRLGGELLLGHFIVRGGGGIYGNPVRQGDFFNRYNLAGGLGYRFKKVNFDLAYSYAESKSAERYIHPQGGLNIQATSYQSFQHSILLTCLIKFNQLY